MVVHGKGVIDMFTEMQINAIIENWGQHVYNKILHECKIYSKKWGLFDLRFFDSYSMNAIFFCKSKIHGDCVLKIGNGFQNREFISEYNVLCEYDNKGLVKIFESDVDEEETGKKIMLLEQIIPGTTLQAEPLLETRLSVFTKLYKGLHVKPDNPGLYQSYAGKMDYYIDIVGKLDECTDLYLHAQKARKVYASLAAEYKKEMLLHGDIHFNNILLYSNGTYTIIDPQGLVGDPVFDIPRYIMSEHIHHLNREISHEKHVEYVNKMVEYLSHSLFITELVLRKCFYVEMVLMECWSATTGRYDMKNVIFADMLMNM